MAVKFHLSFSNKKQADRDNDLFRDKKIALKGANGSTVILIHGITGTPKEMSFLADFLNGKGYSVICPVLANHGKPIEVLRDTKWRECYASVKNAMNEAAASGAGRIFVAGLSVGAIFALLLAEEFPDKIAGVCCFSPTLFYDGWNCPNIKWLLSFGQFTHLDRFFYFKEEPPYGLKNEAIRALVHKYYSRADLHDMKNASRFGYPYFPVALLNQARLLAKYISKRLDRITTPVQLIQAKDDDMTSVKNSQFIYDRISSKVKEIVLLHDSYHIIIADQERDKVAEAMERFFSGCIKKLAK